MLKFKNGSNEIEVATVGELLVALQDIPASTEIHQGFARSVNVSIFKRPDGSQHISFEEGQTTSLNLV